MTIIPKTEGISFLIIQYCYGIIEIANYYEFMEESFNQHIENHKMSIKEIKNEASELLIDMGYDEKYLANQDEYSLADLVNKAEDYRLTHHYLDEVKIFQSTFRTSFLITCYSNFEYQLNKICNEEQKNKSLKLGIGDLDKKGNGITLAKKYLTKVAGIDIPSDKSWQEVTYILKIRNKLVHNNGVLDHEDKEIKEYISRRPDLSIEDDRIILSADYNKYVIRTFYFFLKKVAFCINGVHEGGLISAVP